MVSQKPASITLTITDAATLFSDLSKPNLHLSLNHAHLSEPQKEHVYYHHRLKHISPSNMTRLINLKLLPARLTAASPPPCLGYLLGKSKLRSWRSKSDPLTIRKLSDVKPSNSMSIDYLVSTTPDIKPQALGRLTSVPIAGAHALADHYCKPPFCMPNFLKTSP